MGKKVVYIVSDIDRAVFFEKTAIGLREKGFELTFILINSRNGALDRFLLEHDFKVSYLTVKKISKSIGAIIQCTKLLNNSKADLIHCHLTTANTVGLFAGLLAGIKIRIFTRHSGQATRPVRKEIILNGLHNRLATHIIAISQNTKDILLAAKVKEQKIELIHHGFDLKRMMNPDANEVARIRSSYNPDNQFPVIGVVARWLEWKGIQYIVPAFKELLKTYPNAKLCLFNASETKGYGRHVKELLNELSPRNYLAVPFEYNVYDLYQLFDIYVHVPVNESCEAFGQTYVEALAAGIPSIFTLSGVAREFIHDQQNALVVRFQDGEAILASILTILNNKSITSTITANGTNDVKRLFSMEGYINKLEALYMSKPLSN